MPLLHLWSVAQTSTLRLRLPVPEAIAPYVHDGDAATICIDAPGRTITGKVTRSTGELDMSTRSMQVEVDVPNADGSLTPGMYAQVTLNVKRAGDALVVPIQAVDTSGPQPVLLVVIAQSRVERRAVQTGIATANRIEVAERVARRRAGDRRQPVQLPAGELVTAKQSVMAAAGAAGNAARVKIMSGFAIRYPFFILMLCLADRRGWLTTVARMPVDLFPEINIPVVVVATFYSGMPPEQIEANITDTFERFFTLGSNIDHIESRSLTGVSLIKIYFQPGTDADAAVSEIANLAMADLRRLPQGTLPPVVLKFDASSLPVCLVTLKGQGLNETQLHDQGQFNVRNQIANVPGASVPQPFGGKYRQIQFYVDPVKLEATQLSPMDVVRVVNEANTILPAGDVRIGPKDYNIYSNSQIAQHSEMNDVPLKAIGNGVRASPTSAMPKIRGHPIQHRARRRPELGLSAHPEAGRQQQHHRSRQRRARCASSICSTFPSRWSRAWSSISRLCENRRRERAAARAALAWC